ncbi:MAG TPA: hypothetical protein VHB70_01885 [Parafilimonas sp.]|nr:hypothetical protein [Parafilimonas sp.]
MNEKSHTNDFERYLKDQAGEHRMYPSDHVWKNIRKKIQPPKKWPALSAFTVLIISALVVGTVLNKPVPDAITANFHFSSQSAANITAEKTKSVAGSSKLDVTDEHYSVDQITSNTITTAIENIKINDAVARQLTEPAITVSDETYLTSVATPLKQAFDKNIVVEKSSDIATIQKRSFAKASTINNINYYLFDVESRLRSILNAPPSENRSGGVAFFQSPYNNNDINYFQGNDFKVGPRHSDLFPQALEQISKNASRLDFRFYFTPSISYRHLHEQNQSAPQDVNTVSLQSGSTVKPSSAIHQNPAIGYETGFGIGYALTKKFTLTGGFQFNISQYKIDAFLYKDEPVVLTLDEGKFLSNINTISSLRSTPGSKPLTIKNRYYQISMPIGLDWMAWNNDKVSWGIAGSLQPTYTFDKQPLIMSSNFKNYADGSAYVRNWNVNANLESYFGYSTGSYRWQIGPQIRYQLLPSLVDKYPNREYLLNYGLKIGVVKQLK